jgi:hypothetical protein
MHGIQMFQNGCGYVLLEENLAKNKTKIYLPSSLYI